MPSAEMLRKAANIRRDWKTWVDRAVKRGDCLFVNNMHGIARHVYEGYHNKILPRNIYVCHTCDNGWCLNVDHMWEGTAKENTQDALKKGRLYNPFKKDEK